jgi:cell division protein YceG involved in septum cleavage
VSRGDRSRQARERTAGERERDREERERRRGQLPDAAPAAPPLSPPPEPVEESVEVEPPIMEMPAEEHVEIVPAPAPPSASTELPPLAPELGGPSELAPRPRPSRAPLARIAAVLALLAVIAAVVLVLVPLLRPEHTKTIAAPVVVKVLIPEGKTRAQIAQIATANHLSGDYAKAAQHSPLLHPGHYGAPYGTTNLEGFLFPATYDMTVGEPAVRLVEEQLAAFRENFTESQVARARALHITPYELLTVASMVEREAQIPGDRAKIAAVIYNRLREGITLGIDATIYYAVEQRKGIATYTHELTEAQLRIDSPYNTRTHTGLPPTPISNPGDASIHAAAYPAHVNYLYYVAGADGCGEQVFSDTQSAFEANVAAYHAAVSRNGGRPPTCKHKH